MEDNTTMEQTKSASEVLALIEMKYFRGAGLDKASRTEGDERRAGRPTEGITGFL